jgi:hypothetical protein
MNRLPALLALLLAACAEPPPAAPGAPLKDMLDLAAAAPADGLRPRLESLARAIQEPNIRSKALGAVDQIVAAADLHRRVAGLAKDVTDLGGKATLEPGGPAWMREVTGDGPMELFTRLVGVNLYANVNAHAKDYKLNTRINDGWVDRVAGLPDLRALDLENTDVKGPGLRPVGTLRTLESLNLTLCPVTDEPLAALSELTRVKVLGLASTKVTGIGMKQLQELKKLENLNLHNTPVNDAGLEWIGKLSSLTRLEIVHTQFTDAGAPALAGLVNLERLQVGSRKATGASLAFLRGLPKLRELDVHDGMLAGRLPARRGDQDAAGASRLRRLGRRRKPAAADGSSPAGDLNPREPRRDGCRPGRARRDPDAAQARPSRVKGERRRDRPASRGGSLPRDHPLISSWNFESPGV